MAWVEVAQDRRSLQQNTGQYLEAPEEDSMLVQVVEEVAELMARQVKEEEELQDQEDHC